MRTDDYGVAVCHSVIPGREFDIMFEYLHTPSTSSDPYFQTAIIFPIWGSERLSYLLTVTLLISNRTCQPASTAHVL